tara:strand:+ start:58 stop:1089 length:1032 start_codon:yes stop_codon:yes gene_type:complete
MSMQQMLLGAGGGPPGPDIDDVFSVDTWSGNNTQRDITNGLDLDGEGGVVWVKNRSNTLPMRMVGTTFPTNNWYGITSIDTAQIRAPSTHTDRYWFKDFNSDGFEVGTNQTGDHAYNKSGSNYVGYSFRNCADFFRSGNYQGDGVDSGQTINHGMTTTPGLVISSMHGFKSWAFHKAGGNGKSLNMSSSEDWDTHSGHSWNVNSTSWNAIDHYIVEANYNNTDGWWMAFADHSAGGSFGASGSKKAIICDSYTGNGNSSGPSITLGFQPQWLMIKCATQGGSTRWNVFDSTRGFNKVIDFFSNSESTESYVSATSTGFDVISSDGQVNQNSAEYIFVAIAAST